MPIYMPRNTSFYKKLLPYCYKKPTLVECRVEDGFNTVMTVQFIFKKDIDFYAVMRKIREAANYQ